MKKILLTLATALLSAVVSSAATPQKYTMDVKDFTALSVVDGINVIYKASTDSAGLVTFTTRPELAPMILLSNNKGTLKVQLQNDGTYFLKNLPTLTVYSAFLSKVENSGDSTVTVNSPAPSAELSLRIVGNGRIEASGLHATRIEAKTDAGKGHFALSGQASWVKLRTVGTGSIEAGALKAEKGSIFVGGTGSVDCWITGELTISGLGSGKVYLKGTPKVKNRTLGTVKVVEVK